MAEPSYIDDRDQLNEAEIVQIDWPVCVKKSNFGIVQDYDECPNWSKYCSFFENNSYSNEIYYIYSHDWSTKQRNLMSL